MTVGVLSRMTDKNKYWDSSLTHRMKVTMDSRFRGNDISVVIPHLMRNPESISFQIEKKKDWIPNQVGDDSGVVFGDDSCIVFGDDNGMVFGDEKVLGSSIKYFEDDSGCSFEDDR